MNVLTYVGADDESLGRLQGELSIRPSAARPKSPMSSGIAGHSPQILRAKGGMNFAQGDPQYEEVAA